MGNRISETAKERSIVITLGGFAGAALSIIGFLTFADSQILSEFEHENVAPHSALNEKLDVLKVEARCATLRIEISLLDREVYDLSQTAPDSLRHREKSNSLTSKRAKYDQLLCVKFE